MKIIALLLVLALPDSHLLVASLSAASRFAAGQSRTSDGPCRIPNVLGLDQAAAARRLAASDLSVGRVEARSSTTAPGVVIDQSPKACGNPSGNGAVDLVVSTGNRSSGSNTAPPKQGGGGAGTAAIAGGVIGAIIIGAIAAKKNDPRATVPNVVNRTVPLADEALKKARLQMGAVTSRDSTAAGAGIVLEQSPRAGSKVPPETVVTLVVSAGPKMTVVPDVAKREWRDAEATIAASQLRAVTKNPEQGENQQLVVESQIPSAGTQVVVGAAVQITLAVPPPVVPPAVAIVIPAPAPILPSPPPTPVAAPPTPPRPSRVVSNPPVAPVPTPPRPPRVVSNPPVAPVPAPDLPLTIGTAPIVTAPIVAAPPIAPPVVTAAGGAIASAQTPAAPTLVPVVVVTPPNSTGREGPWWWPWILLLALPLLLLAPRLWRKAPLPPAAPLPAPPRITFIPRLDTAGQQMFAITDDRGNHTFEVAVRLDAGRQQLKYGSHPVEDTGTMS